MPQSGKPRGKQPISGWIEQSVFGDGETNRRSSIHLALGPDLTAVTRDDACDRGQTDAGSLELFGRVQALKGLEQFLDKTHVEPAAVVADEEDIPTVPTLEANFD